MTHIIRKVILFGIFIGLACALTSMLIGLLVYFISLSLDSLLAFTILKFTVYISVGIGVFGMLSVYGYTLYLVKYFIKNGVKI